MGKTENAIEKLAHHKKKYFLKKTPDKNKDNCTCFVTQQGITKCGKRNNKKLQHSHKQRIQKYFSLATMEVKHCKQ